MMNDHATTAVSIQPNRPILNQWAATLNAITVMRTEVPATARIVARVQGDAQVEIAELTGIKLSRVGDLWRDAGNPATIDELDVLARYITNSFTATELAAPTTDARVVIPPMAAEPAIVREPIGPGPATVEEITPADEAEWVQGLNKI